MVKAVWIVTAVLAVLSFLTFLGTIGGLEGAPQEAALAAVCMAFVVIPYVFARALESLAALKAAKQKSDS